MANNLSMTPFECISASSFQCIGLSNLRQTSCVSSRRGARCDEPSGCKLHINNKYITTRVNFRGVSFLSFVMTPWESAPMCL